MICGSPTSSIASGINPTNATVSRTPVANDIRIGISAF